MDPAVPLGKFVTGVLCIGSGHSMGREGPSVQIGAGLASAIGQWLRLSPAQIKNLIPVAASAALAAAFNTPISAVLFSLEEIVGDMNAPLLGSTVVASVAAVMVERSILGNEPLFRVPQYRLLGPGELLAYAALGVIGGLASLAFCKGLLGARRVFMRMPASTRMWQPAMGGVVIGLVLVFFPASGGRGISVRGRRPERRSVALDHGDALRRQDGRHDHFLLERQRGRHLRAKPLSRSDARRQRGRPRGPLRAVPRGRTWRLRPRRHGDALRRHHSRAR